MRYRFVPALLMALGCSDGTGPAPGETAGTFIATLTGAIPATRTGQATLVVGAAPGRGPSYSVQLYLASGASPFSLSIEGDGRRPVVGTYDVTPATAPQSRPTVVVMQCAEDVTPCGVVWGSYWETPAGAGRLDITRSSTAGLVGSLEVDLRTENAPQYAGQLLHVSARFHATCESGVAC